MSKMLISTLFHVPNVDSDFYWCKHRYHQHCLSDCEIYLIKNGCDKTAYTVKADIVVVIYLAIGVWGVHQWRVSGVQCK